MPWNRRGSLSLSLSHKLQDLQAALGELMPYLLVTWSHLHRNINIPPPPEKIPSSAIQIAEGENSNMG